jgi:hypothetical protein
MSVETVSLVVAGAALAVSVGTSWFTLMRRGELRVTRPSLIFFGPDGSRGPTKVFLRLFVYATGDRGWVVENMYVRLSDERATKAFTSWIIKDGTLTRATGLSVGREGAAADHHFLLPDRSQVYDFKAGKYVLDLFAHCVGDTRPRVLTSQSLEITAEQADAIKRTDAGVFFDWNPDIDRYEVRVDRNRLAELNAGLDDFVRLPKAGGPIPSRRDA